jgi:hypothetical protein
MSLTVKEFSVNEVGKKYIGTPSMRKYWRERKRKQREKKKLAQEMKRQRKNHKDSKIMVAEDRSYYVFINIPNDCIANALLEISPYPEAAR